MSKSEISHISFVLRNVQVFTSESCCYSAIVAMVVVTAAVVVVVSVVACHQMSSLLVFHFYLLDEMNMLFEIMWLFTGKIQSIRAN